jgi:hypothetical protein
MHLYENNCDKIKDRWHVCERWEMYITLCLETRMEQTTWKNWRRWEYDIKMNLKRNRLCVCGLDSSTWGYVQVANCSEYGNELSAGNFLTCWANINRSIKTLFHRASYVFKTNSPCVQCNSLSHEPLLSMFSWETSVILRYWDVSHHYRPIPYIVRNMELNEIGFCSYVAWQNIYECSYLNYICLLSSAYIDSIPWDTV